MQPLRQHLDTYLQGLFALATDSTGEVRKWAIGASSAILLDTFVGHGKSVTAMATAAQVALEGHPQTRAIALMHAASAFL